CRRRGASENMQCHVSGFKLIDCETRYLHLECWAFRVGPFSRRQLKNISNPRGDLIYIPVSSNKGRAGWTVLC
ncbi:hypothetical protein, partial [Salmonella enterica]|uniref:hypothetical protein n=1 Tax=Salmonella enterica TaxID=28901 RepID=UPI0020C4142B